MWGWRILPAREASFWNCCRYTAPNSGSRNTSGSIVFSATILPVKVSLARYTVPVAPLPSAVWISYLPTSRLRPMSGGAEAAAAGGEVAAMRSGVHVGGFDDGIELDRVAPLLARAVARALAAAERHMVVHPGRGQVDHDHARGRISLEMLGVLERGRGDARGKPERRVVRHRERLLVALH